MSADRSAPWAFRVGVDGGGSGTRVRVVDALGREMAQGRAGPSGLSRGVAAAWQAIETAIDVAFDHAGRARPPRAAMAVGVGVAGANHEAWARAFLAAQPGFGLVQVASDAWTTLLGAHGGAAGAVVAVGTGSVGAALASDGQRRSVGGWGFPSGDEGGGAWLGLTALGLLQRVLDGRQRATAFARKLLAHCGGDHDGLLAWQAQADPARYASLAPVVLAHAPQDPAARALVEQAGRHLEVMARALDPDGTLPLALCGGLAGPLRPYLPPGLRDRARPAREDAAWGALHLLDEGRLPLPEAPAADGPALAPAPPTPDSLRA